MSSEQMRLIDPKKAYFSCRVRADVCLPSEEIRSLYVWDECGRVVVFCVVSVI